MNKNKQQLDDLLGKLQALLKTRDALPEEVVIFLEECQLTLIELKKDEEPNKVTNLLYKWGPSLVRLMIYLLSEDTPS